MLIVNFYQFSKRVNSTKRPANDTPTQAFDCEISTTTSLLTPSLIVDFTALQTGTPAYNPTVWTYVYIPVFNRYYFITNWTWANGVYICDLAVDTLATYKVDIYSASLYVLRATKKYNGNLIDTMYPATANVVDSCITKATPWESSISSTNGTFVIGVVGNDPENTAGVTYYALPLSAFRVFMRNLYTSTDWLDISPSEISSSLQKILFNPAQYVVSVMWFPMVLTGAADTLEVVRMGWWIIPAVTTFKLKDRLWQTGEIEIDIPKHPQAASRGNWLNLSPYSVYTLEFWPFGTMPLDTTRIANVNTLVLSYVVDYITGTAILRVTAKGGNDAIIYTTTAQLGVPISLAHISYDISQLTATNTLLAGATSVVTNNNIVGKVAAGAKSVVGGIKAALGVLTEGREAQIGAAQPYFEDAASAVSGVVDDVPAAIADSIGAAIGSPVTKGANGSTAQLGLGVRVSAHFTKVAPEDNEHNGRPLCEVVKLSALDGGFVKCQSGDIDIIAPVDEKRAIAQFLTGGCYLE